MGNGHFPPGQFTPDNSPPGQFPLPTRIIPPHTAQNPTLKLHTYIHVCTHSYIYTYMHIHIDACRHIYTRTIHTCIHTIHTYNTYMHTIHTCIHTIHTCMHIHLYAVIYHNIFWHTYIHT